MLKDKFTQKKEISIITHETFLELHSKTASQRSPSLQKLKPSLKRCHLPSSNRVRANTFSLAATARIKKTSFQISFHLSGLLDTWIIPNELHGAIYWCLNALKQVSDLLQSFSRMLQRCICCEMFCRLQHFQQSISQLILRFLHVVLCQWD